MDCPDKFHVVKRKREKKKEVYQISVIETHKICQELMGNSI